MNVKVLTAVATAAIVFLGSCDKEQKPTKTFGVKEATLAVKDTDEKAEVTVLGNVAFEVKDLKVDGVDPKTGELTVSPLKGDKGAKLTVTFKANTENTAKTYTFNVVTKDEEIAKDKRSVKVTITQAAKASTAKAFGVDNATHNVEAATKTINVKVTGNVAWTIAPVSGLTFTPNSGDGTSEVTVKVDFAENTTTSPVSHTFHVVTTDAGIDAGKRDITVTITQAAKPVAKTFGVENKTVTVNADATSATVKVTGNVEWKTKDKAATITTIAPETGNGAASLTISFAANTENSPKNHTFKVYTEDAEFTGEKEIEVTITQEAKS